MLRASDGGYQAASVPSVRRDVVGDCLALLTEVSVLLSPHEQIIPRHGFRSRKDP